MCVCVCVYYIADLLSFRHLELRASGRQMCDMVGFPVSLHLMNDPRTSVAQVFPGYELDTLWIHEHILSNSALFFFKKVFFNFLFYIGV